MSDSQRTTTLTLIVDTLGVVATHLGHAEREVVDMTADLKTEMEWLALTPELEKLQAEIRSSAERVAGLIRDHAEHDVIRRL